MSARAEPGARFVAATGQVLESDHSITAGQATDAGGIVSRKSQLRALEEQASALDKRIDQGEQDQAWPCRKTLRGRDFARVWYV